MVPEGIKFAFFYMSGLPSSENFMAMGALFQKGGQKVLLNSFVMMQFS